MSNVFTYRCPPPAALHEGAKRGHIDATAPVQARADRVLRVAVEPVWAALVDVPGWDRTFEPGVSNVQLERGVVVDGGFTRWNAGVRTSARFAVVEPHRELAWTGRRLGARTVHRLELRPLGRLRTLVVLESSIAAARASAAPLLALALDHRRLRLALRARLAALAEAVEPQVRVG